MHDVTGWVRILRTDVIRTRLISVAVLKQMQRLEVVRGHSEFLSHFSLPQANQPRLWHRAGSTGRILHRVLYICLRLTYRREFSRQKVPDPYIFGKLRARRFDRCIARLQQRSFRAFIAESIISTVPVIQYGAAEMTACNDCSQQR